MKSTASPITCDRCDRCDSAGWASMLATRFPNVDANPDHTLNCIIRVLELYELFNCMEHNYIAIYLMTHFKSTLHVKTRKSIMHLESLTHHRTRNRETKQTAISFSFLLASASRSSDARVKAVEFSSAHEFSGARQGCTFKLGEHGLGYYRDDVPDDGSFLCSPRFLGRYEGFVFTRGQYGVGYYRDGRGASSCAICLSDLQHDRNVAVLRCAHRFHMQCIDAWLAVRPDAGCPVCRTAMVDEEQLIPAVPIATRRKFVVAASSATPMNWPAGSSGPSHGAQVARPRGANLFAPIAYDPSRLPFEVVAIDGKGMGCVATRTVEIGERLLAEAPLTVEGEGHPSLAESVAALSDEDRTRFYALAHDTAIYGDNSQHVDAAESLEGIRGTNGIPYYDRGELCGGIFAVASRFNHACDASAVYKWNSWARQLTVHAVRRIRPGEEICINCALRHLCTSAPTGMSQPGMSSSRARPHRHEPAWRALLLLSTRAEVCAFAIHAHRRPRRHGHIVCTARSAPACATRDVRLRLSLPKMRADWRDAGGE